MLVPAVSSLLAICFSEQDQHTICMAHASAPTPIPLATLVCKDIAQLEKLSWCGSLLVALLHKVDKVK
jgi:hypothetical protein